MAQEGSLHSSKKRVKGMCGVNKVASALFVLCQSHESARLTDEQNTWPPCPCDLPLITLLFNLRRLNAMTLIGLAGLFDSSVT